jgi:hypothetical protein
LTAITRSHSSDRDVEPGPAREHAHERGIVDEHVDGAEGFDRSLCHRFGGCFACNVGGKPDRLQALRDQGLGHRFRRGGIDIGRDHVGAGLGELFRIDLADPLAAAGDDDGASDQIKALVHAGASMDQAPTLHATPGRGQASRQVRPNGQV